MSEKILSSDNYRLVIYNTRDTPIKLTEAGEYSLLFREAYNEYAELKAQSFNEFYSNSIKFILDTEKRIDIGLHVNEDGCVKLVGGAVLCPDIDIHVGKCLSVMFNYVKKDYRGQGGAKLMRAIRDIARYVKTPYLAFTHRREHYYITKYRRVK